MTSQDKTGNDLHKEYQTLMQEYNSLRELYEKDIKLLKEAKNDYRMLSQRQEAIIAAVPEIIMEVNENKIYTWANWSGIKFFGEDVIGKEASFYFEGEQETYSVVQPLFVGDEDIFYVES